MDSGTWTLDRAQGEPSIGKEKNKGLIHAGVGAVVLGALLAATSSSSATISIIDPITGQPINSTISARSNGHLGGDVAPMGLGGVLLRKGRLF